MAFPPDSLCIELPEIPDMEDICFPGGFCLSYIWDSINSIPNETDMSLDFFSQLGPAMSFMSPFFQMLDLILAIFRCLEAFGDFATSLDPSGIFECFPALLEMVNKILSLLPYLSIPKMIKAILRRLAGLLRSLAADLEYIKSQIQRIIDLIERAAFLNDATMNGFLVCAQNNMDQTTLSTAEALKGIGRIILLANILMGLFGGPEIPCFGELLSENIGEGIDFLIDLLTALADILMEIHDLIFDPDLVLTLLLGDQKC